MVNLETRAWHRSPTLGRTLFINHYSKDGPMWEPRTTQYRLTRPAPGRLLVKLSGVSNFLRLRKSGVPDLRRPRLTNRNFGLTLGGLLLFVGLASWFLAGQRLDWAFVVGGIVLVTASIAPTILLPVNLMWHSVAKHLRIITNWVVLGSIFYLIITPAGLVLRLFRHDPLALTKNDRTVDSYFTPVQRRSNAETMLDWF